MDFIEGRFIYGDNEYVDDMYMDEQWQYIKGFPNYMISNKGRVWSNKNQKVLKNKPMDDHGHLGVCLYAYGKRIYKYIHRLIAEAFIPNPDNLPVVRHIDDDPTLNISDNLLWGTQKDNINDIIRNGRAYVLTDEDRYKGNKKRMMKIMSTNIESGHKEIFESQCEASKVLGIPQANIYKVVHGERKSAGGYFFKEVK